MTTILILIIRSNNFYAHGFLLKQSSTLYVHTYVYTHGILVSDHKVM